MDRSTHAHACTHLHPHTWVHTRSSSHSFFLTHLQTHTSYHCLLSHAHTYYLPFSLYHTHPHRRTHTCRVLQTGILAAGDVYRVYLNHVTGVCCPLTLCSVLQPSFVSDVGAPGRSSLDSTEVAYGRQVRVSANQTASHDTG